MSASPPSAWDEYPRVGCGPAITAPDAGENIYPREIEVVVHQLPQISEAAVVGRRHPTYGEEPVLFVCTPPDTAVTADAIRDHIAARLAKYKWPVDITILDELPKNSVGKIDKPALGRLMDDSVITTSTNKSARRLNLADRSRA